MRRSSRAGHSPDFNRARPTAPQSTPRETDENKQLLFAAVWLQTGRRRTNFWITSHPAPVATVCGGGLSAKRPNGWPASLSGTSSSWSVISAGPPTCCHCAPRRPGLCHLLLLHPDVWLLSASDTEPAVTRRRPLSRTWCAEEPENDNRADQCFTAQSGVKRAKVKPTHIRIKSCHRGETNEKSAQAVGGRITITILALFTLTKRCQLLLQQRIRYYSSVHNSSYLIHLQIIKQKTNSEMHAGDVKTVPIKRISNIAK